MKKLFFGLMILVAGTAEAQVKKTTTAKKPVAVKKVTPAKPAAKKPVTATKPKPIVKPVADNAVRVRIWTDSGTMIVKLYDSTPLHRDNFKKLVEQKFYDSLLFHRVISGFMIQGGDPMSKNAQPDQMLGGGGSDMMRIPAEFRTSLIHKRGALAAARDGNPEKASSACQFYIVQGKLMNDAELAMMEARMPVKYTAAQRATYKEVGGTPFLDQNYTVFGEVISGFDVIDKISSVQKNAGDRPLTDVHMRMEIIK